MASTMSKGEYPHRVAMISMHTSPLETPGVGDAGGLNVYVAEVARRLGERGLHIDIFTRRRDPSTPAVVEAFERVNVHHVTAGPTHPVPKETMPGLVQDFAAGVSGQLDSYDLVHSHYWLSGLVGLELANNHSVPLVHTMHTMARVKNTARGPGHAAEPDVRGRGEAAVVAAADMLTANTPDEASDLRSHYGARVDQVMIVPPGVDLHMFHPCDQPKSRAQLGVPEDSQVILFVGRIQPLKAPDVLIRTVARMIKDEPARRARLRLIIIGSPSGPEGEWASTLPEMAATLGVEDVVEFRPHSPRQELFRWYCVCDIVGVPSYNESFGLVALEAQACGRPVVATDVGGLRHAVDNGHTGILVPGHRPERWADSMAKLLDDQDLALWLGENAAVHAARFSWDNSAAATLEAYHAAHARRR
jgi:D-inositol-3-phosphate glycosyltransferase